uniref:Ras and EF-hand domain-containing protein n=1 Tax=Hydra vulgaris TaxID=6087 RepID=T2MAA7_HYDVU
MSNVDENALMKRELLDAELDSSGFIDEVELAAVVDLKPYELKQIFARLDTDKDGKISITDFMENYTLFQSYADVKNTSMQPEIKTNSTEYFENGKIALKENSNDSGFNSTNTAMKIPDASSDDTLKVPDDMMRIPDASMSLKNSSLKVSDAAFNLKNKPLIIDLKTEAKNQLGQEYLDDLYEIARSRDDPLLLDSLENFLAATVDNLLRKQAENEYLELSLKRATLKNNEFSSQLEQEMDQHVQMLEEKIRQEEQQKLAIQKQEAYQQLIIAQKELAEMENKVKMLEKQVEEKSVKTVIPNTILEEIKLKEKENETLHLRLLEFQTQMALMRTEVAKLKCEYDEQSDRLQKERVTVLDCVQEQENLTRQLHLLHEANKKLHDTNDDLRSAMEVKRSNSYFIGSPVKRTTSLVLTKYRQPNLHSSFRSDPGPDLNLNDFDDTDIEDASGRSIIPYDEEVIDKSSLMAELMEADDQVHNGYMSGKKPVRVLSLENSASSTPQKHVDRERFVRQLEVLCETNRRLGESNDELREALGILSERLRPPDLIKKSSGCQSAPVTPSRRIYSSPISSSPQKLSIRSQRQFDEDVDDYNMPDEELARLVNQTNDDDFSSTSEELITVEEKIIEPCEAAKNHVLKREFGVGADTSGESLSAKEGDATVPERMYKLVLVGNAAVGKSSFIIRLCKNKFYSSLNSTLGVDFQIKNLQLNGKTVALQLWDTAGQERFRSIAKSYFRKVDGVILMYDVTCESSFMDVRDWLESIKEGSSKTVPIIICGNKTDLRLDARRKGMPVVSQEQGQRLANDIGALFIETSAKEGTNITNTCIELTKQLIQNDEKRLSATGMQLNKQPSQTKKNGCCR